VAALERQFPGPAELCSPAGLTPRHRQSDTKVSRSHITKHGSRNLRWALIEAIQHVPAAATRCASAGTTS
jgi:transposase